jgi:hypothetical protein
MPTRDGQGFVYIFLKAMIVGATKDKIPGQDLVPAGK